jgi:hypothetical protein
MFKKKYLKFKRRYLFPILFIFISVIFFGLFKDINNANACGALPSDWDDCAINVVNAVVGMVMKLVGGILLFLIDVLIKVIEFDTIPTAVTEGWTIVRDLLNMFFIVILMIVAVSTVLRIETYNYKKMVPKLLLMAVLINFSKMFTLLLIDASQIVTLTFLESFKGGAAGNLINAFGIDKMTTISAVGDLELNVSGIAVSTILGVAFILIASIIVASFLFMFLARIIAFWILIVFSPVAYFGSAAGSVASKYADMWWTSFSKYLIVGPVLSFFLWLSLSIMSQDVSGAIKTNTSSIGDSAFGAPENIMRFIVSIAMLLGSLIAAEQIGSYGSKESVAWARKNMSSLKSGAGKFAARTSLTVAGGATALVGGGLAGVAGGLAGRAGWGGQGGWAGARRGFGAGAIPGNFLRTWGADMRADHTEEKEKARLKTLQNMGMGENTLGQLHAAASSPVGRVLANASAGTAIGSVIAPGIGTVAGLAGGLAVSGIGHRLQTLGEGRMQEGQQQARTNNFVRSAINNWIGQTMRSSGLAMQRATTDPTEGATHRGIRDINSANLQSQQIADNTIAANQRYRGVNAALGIRQSWQSASGLKNRDRHFWNNVSNPNQAGVAQAANIAGAVNLQVNGTHVMTPDEAENLAQAITSYLSPEGGGAINPNIQQILTALNGRQILHTTFQPNVAYRETGIEGIKGSGNLSVDSFAKGKSNTMAIGFDELGPEIINKYGLSASKLGLSGKDLSIEGKAEFAGAISGVIDAEIGDLNNLKLSGKVGEGADFEIKENSFIERMNNLLNAKKRLSDPKNLDNLELINSSSNNYGRHEVIKTKVHEDVHSAGVKSEKVTEALAQNITAGRVYSHTKDLANTAANMEKAGSSEDEIIEAMNKEIYNRAGSRAKQVLDLEKGKIPTEEEFAQSAIRESENSKSNKAQQQIELLKNEISSLEKKYKESPFKEEKEKISEQIITKEKEIKNQEQVIKNTSTETQEKVETVKKTEATPKEQKVDTLKTKPEIKRKDKDKVEVKGFEELLSKIDGLKQSTEEKGKSGDGKIDTKALVFTFDRLHKAITKQTNATKEMKNKISNLMSGVSSDSSPLEIEVVTKEIERLNKINNEELNSEE